MQESKLPSKSTVVYSEALLLKCSFKTSLKMQHARWRIIIRLQLWAIFTHSASSLKMTEKNYPRPCGMDVRSYTIFSMEKKKTNPLNSPLLRHADFCIWNNMTSRFENRRRKVGNAGRLWTPEPWDLHDGDGHGQIHRTVRVQIFHSSGAVKTRRDTVPAKITDQVYQEYTSPQLIQFLEEEIFRKPLSSNSLYTMK